MNERNVIVILSNAAPGAEDEYNDWYTNCHLAQIVSIPGIVSAQRFEYTGLTTVPYPNTDDDPHPSRRYLALYEVEGDPREVVAAIRAARASDAIARPESIVDISAWVFRSITDVITSDGVPPEIR